jgi:aerobic-type carbon monoxide dehydrogenase small subunit (CoxS/CutS family)
MVTLNVNGRSVDLDIDPKMPLLWALRDFLGLTGTKYGCGRALCGACTVHIDDAVKAAWQRLNVVHFGPVGRPALWEMFSIMFAWSIAF